MALASAYPSIVCFGDSQTQYASGPGGFVARLADTYQRRADVFNRGFSGYTTREALYVARQIFRRAPHADSSILAVIVWLGCNDSIEQGQKQNVPLELFRANLSSIIDLIAYTTDEVPAYVLLLGPTPVIDRPFHRNEAKKEYSRVVSEVARDAQHKSRVDYIDMYQLFSRSSVPVADLLHPDGLHISPRGYEVIFDAIFERLRRQDGLEPSSMRIQFPDWKDINTDAVEEGVKP